METNKFKHTEEVKAVASEPRKNGDNQYSLGVMIKGHWFNYYGTKEQVDIAKEKIKKGQQIRFNENALIITDFEVDAAPVNNQASKPMSKMQEIAQDYLVKIQGTDFIKYIGIIRIAQEMGGILSKEVINIETDEAWTKAMARVRVTMNDGRIFEDTGTCTPDNSKGVKAYPVELATTRAYARAIRTGLGIDFCSLEEREGSD